MIIRQNLTAIGPGVKTPFLASAGTSPYTYSVIAGGAGGTINASTGLYTAPLILSDDPLKSFDTISVTDSSMVPVVVTTTINVLSPIQLLLNVIGHEMSLSPDQLHVFNQKFDIPKDSRIYISAMSISSKPFGNSNRTVSGSGVDSVQSSNVRDLIQLDIMSRSISALRRKEEILMSFASTYAQQQMQANSFYIAILTQNFLNLSAQDGAAIPYRFNISVGLQYFIKKTTAVPYFDDFSDVSAEYDT